jgi:hypothetical protein
MLTSQTLRGPTPSDFLGAMLALVVWLSHPALADTAYRCGNTYSASSQCNHGEAIAVRPANALSATGQGKNNASADLREAQALEKQRLQAERQAAHTAAVRITAPHAPPASDTPPAPVPQHGEPKSLHSKKRPSPYFTAVDPHAGPKKKGTAKALPDKASTSP